MKPADREVICHASAWNLDNKDDLRIKMCTQVNADGFRDRAPRARPQLSTSAPTTSSRTCFSNGANDGFHEAIGDIIALSITPEYLVQIGLLDAAKVPDAGKDTACCCARRWTRCLPAVRLLVDKWRWGVFDGRITPAEYNKAWGDLSAQYQGIVPPVERREDDFDPGAKYHIPGNVPYTRYFLARVLQFQFYQAACEMAGWKGPLHRCSFYGNKEVGEKLNAMLAMGAFATLARCARGLHRQPRDGRRGGGRLFRAAEGLAEEQNEGQQCGW